MPALDQNCFYVVEVPSVLADASLKDRLNSGLSCMTSGDMLEYLHHTQTISVKCKQTTRAVVIYIGCDQKLLFRFSVLSSGVQPSELYRKTDHLFGDVNRPAPPGSGGGWYTSLLSNYSNTIANAKYIYPGSPTSSIQPPHSAFCIVRANQSQQNTY